ncbi:PH domain-containing protein [Agromyces sp. Leaf222]|uniref:PH domain-containing protein n=1 Tax=Agromyces sp. Leaf222 TaxID=1735688 RepID=UPI0006F43AD6|nr:PH domain-containing protein [Agromyces sp. Leaf222]KQM84164.1 hypothetical protein ASE68_13925 [Agromyces sp. Leaf222]
MARGSDSRAVKKAARSSARADAEAASAQAARPGADPRTGQVASTGFVPGGTAAVIRPERVVARVRSHARRLIPSALLLIVVAGATTYGLGVLEDSWAQLGLLAGAVLVVLVGCLLPLIAWLTRRTTITTRRVILRHGVFSRVRQELLNSRATDVDVRAGWFASMFGSGDVRINTAHDRTFVLQDVPRPELVQAALQELMDPSSPAAIEHRRAMLSGADGDTVAWHRR